MFESEERANVMLEEIKKLIVKSSVSLTALYKKCGYKTDNLLPDRAQMHPLPGGVWAEEYGEHAWFYLCAEIPETAGGERASLFVENAPGRETSNPQYLAYVNGKIVCGLDNNHTEIRFEKAGRYDVFLYAYSGNIYDYGIRTLFTVKVIDEKTEKLYYDLSAPVQVLAYSEEESGEYAKLLYEINRTLNLLDLRRPYSSSYYKGLELALRHINGNLYKKDENKPVVVGIGHTHIDIAWLWPYRLTREKAVHSFATALKLMEEYPDYKFMSSQAILYQIVKEDAPEVYEKIKERIAEGRWEAEGAMWLEADCNLTSGESLVRQILYGKRFFQEEFGVDCKILWLPDVFGYSAAMPQILKKSGVDTFVTSKISWNDTNQIPFDTFYWRGIDGTRIFSYFLTPQDKVRGRKPVRYTTYTANSNAQQIAGTWQRYQQKELNDEALLTFGYGDGGGGPTAEMIERMRRAGKGIPNCPNAKIGTVKEFFAHLKENAEGKRVPEINGELYLEFHRGTYTNIAKNKRNNRKAEFLYQNAELISAAAELLAGGQYPKAELEEGWELILKNQFHDILPGSSIEEVYDDSDEDYKKVFAIGEGVLSRGLNAIARRIETEKAYIAFNFCTTAYSGPVQVNGRYFNVEEIPGKGWKAVNPETGCGDVRVHGKVLSNEYYELKFDKNWNISRLYDKKRKRDVFRQGCAGNVLEVHEDYPPGYYDGWELRSYHNEKIWEMSGAEAEFFDEGARKGFLIKKHFSDSSVTQKICLYDHFPRIDFETEADWHDEHKCLKARFPIDINASKATYDIQFGNVERATTRNNSWETAKFEVCGHKFADVSESDYGVSLMNDCKYGYEVEGADMRITLLRCATYPNPNGDKGKHSFTYALYAHEGDARNSESTSQSFFLNNPVILVKAGDKGDCKEEFSLLAADAANIVADTVKKAENGRGFIVRLYESANKFTRAKIAFGVPVRRAAETDLTERETNGLSLSGGNTVALEFRPFEIKTIFFETEKSGNAS